MKKFKASIKTFVVQNHSANPMFFENSIVTTQIRIFTSEFLGTAIFMILGCMGNMEPIGEVYRSQNNEGLSFGIATLICVRIFSKMSGGHINPIITFCSLIVQMVPLLHVPIFFLGQFSGAIAGCALFKVITPMNSLGGGAVNNTSAKQLGACSPYIERDTDWSEAIVYEFVTSAILCWCWCSIWDYRNMYRMETGVFRYGVTYTALIICGDSVTRANMNPARSLAPALLNGDWDYHWVFWGGPFLGSLVAGVLYVLILYESPRAYAIQWF